MEAKCIREQLCKIYPSDMSFRCFLQDSIETLPKNSIVYLIAEGDNIILVFDEDLQPKFNVPIDSIIKFNRYITTIREPIYTSSQYTPNYTLDSVTITSIEYNTVDSNKVLNLILANDQLSVAYNKISTAPKKDMIFYITAHIKKTGRITQLINGSLIDKFFYNYLSYKHY